MNPEEHPTSNIQRRTSNDSANPRSLRRSVFDVGCSMFSIGSGISTRELSFPGNLSPRRVGSLSRCWEESPNGEPLRSARSLLPHPGGEGRGEGERLIALS